MMAKNMDRLTKNFTAASHPTMGATQLICRREVVSAYIAIVTLSNVLSQILSAITTSDPAYRYRSGNINIFHLSMTCSNCRSGTTSLCVKVNAFYLLFVLAEYT